MYGTCVSGGHTDCGYGLGRQFPNGIKLSDGTRYTCPCGCHRGEMVMPSVTRTAWPHFTSAIVWRAGVGLVEQCFQSLGEPNRVRERATQIQEGEDGV